VIIATSFASVGRARDLFDRRCDDWPSAFAGCTVRNSVDSIELAASRQELLHKDSVKYDLDQRSGDRRNYHILFRISLELRNTDSGNRGKGRVGSRSSPSESRALLSSKPREQLPPVIPGHWLEKMWPRQQKKSQSMSVLRWPALHSAGRPGRLRAQPCAPRQVLFSAVRRPLYERDKRNSREFEPGRTRPFNPAEGDSSCHLGRL
jgi:hypothetical protein